MNILYFFLHIVHEIQWYAIDGRVDQILKSIPIEFKTNTIPISMHQMRNSAT
jgi:hypothetical protein